MTDFLTTFDEWTVKKAVIGPSAFTGGANDAANPSVAYLLTVNSAQLLFTATSTQP